MREISSDAYVKSRIGLALYGLSRQLHDLLKIVTVWFGEKGLLTNNCTALLTVVSSDGVYRTFQRRYTEPVSVVSHRGCLSPLTRLQRNSNSNHIIGGENTGARKGGKNTDAGKVWQGNDLRSDGDKTIII